MKHRKLVLSANTGWYVTHFLDKLVHHLKAAGYVVVIVAPHEPALDSQVAELGIEWIPISIERAATNPLVDLRLILRYRAILKHAKPYAFLGFTAKPNIYGSFAARSLGIPAIATVNGLGTAFIRGGMIEHILSWLYRCSFRNGARVLFQNPDDRELFIARKIVTAAQTGVVPGVGVDLERFRATVLPDPPLTFLMIGRVLRDKGVHEYVQAARLVRNRSRHARFQLLGSIDAGNRTAIGRAELDSWVAGGSIEYLGETTDVRPFIARATVVVLPSYREGLPRALLEAAAMARPLVATDVPGCRELVDDGDNGFLCRARDTGSLAEAMGRICDLPRHGLEAMAASSRQRVHERFSDHVVARTYLDVLDSIERS